MNKYIYRGQPEERVFGPLPEGDYTFRVTDCGEPYFKNEHWVLPLRLTIEPQGAAVFANPWSGVNKNGEDRDGIAEFLVAIKRAPAKGQEPDWAKIVGAKGRCRLKIEVASMGNLAGKEVNKVSFFHRPKELGEHPAREPDMETTQEKDELAREPDDIPF